MPIVDYKHKAEVSEKNFFNNPKVSKDNKAAVKDFLVGWKVRKGKRKGLPISFARREIFFKHIHRLLENTKNIKEDMHSPEIMDKIFNKLQKDLSINYYSTVINISQTLVTKINDGIKPKGFKNIQNISKEAQKRKLEPKDMIKWEEGIELSKATPSIQMKAVILTQLDGGFRPSELIDLNYGDIEIKKDFIIANVKDGKTGARPVILFRGVPYLVRWLQNHPTRKTNDPLWISERDNITRYRYPALIKRVRDIGDKIKLKKPLDFYNLRHSACLISKLDNIPLEEAAKKFGHSVEFYTNTYGRMDTSGSIVRHGKCYGVDKSKQKMDINIICDKCETSNIPKAEICEKCGSPLSIKKAMEMDRGKDLEMAELKKQMAELLAKVESIGNIEKALKIQAKA